jgi:hypothetical protein
MARLVSSAVFVFAAPLLGCGDLRETAFGWDCSTTATPSASNGLIARRGVSPP